MDKNQVIGIALIALVVLGFYHFTKPSEEELAHQQHMRDSIAAVQASQQQAEAAYQSSTSNKIEEEATYDTAYVQTKYGDFAAFVNGKEQFYTLENEELKVVLSNKGAKVYSVELKKYLTCEKEPLILFEGDESTFNFNFFSSNNRPISSEKLYFEAASATANSVDFVLDMPSGKQMKISYTLPTEGYLLSTSIDGKKLAQILPRSQTALDIEWNQNIRQVEKGLQFEQRYSGLYYKYNEAEVGFLRGGSDKEEKLSTKVKWIAYKDQFFSSILLSESAFSSAFVKQQKAIPNDGYTHYMSADISAPINGEDINYQFYFGPNKYKTLKGIGYNIDRLVDMGRGPIRWINKYMVITTFNFLERFIGNYGLIILIMTILIKLIVFPFTYKSYISTAKMRVLKPQIDEINEKIPADKAMERQQATMALYKKVGVSPMGGCLPMLLSMPFLLAMFRFFPGSIELRQQSFLWAKDLASYDAIISWSAQIPLLSKIYGNHISLFCLLMAATNLIYTKINQEMTQTSSAMPGMKGMMYMMPIMFLFMFNRYSAGLSYYYFVSTLITIAQTVLMRRMVNEEALLAQLHANKKKPKKTSKFQQRLADMQKQQQQMAKQNAKKRK